MVLDRVCGFSLADTVACFLSVRGLLSSLPLECTQGSQWSWGGVGLALGALREPTDLVVRSPAAVLSEAPGGTCYECNQQGRCPLPASFLISHSRGGPTSVLLVLSHTPGLTRYSLLPLSPEGDVAITG